MSDSNGLTFRLKPFGQLRVASNQCIRRVRANLRYR